MTKFFRKIFKFRLTIASIVLCLSIVVFTSKPTQQLEINWQLYDKLLHFLVFGLLSLNLLGGIMELKRTMSIKIAVILSMTISFLYGVMTEVIQYYIPYRKCSLMDLLADFLGIFIFCMIFFFLSHLKVFNKIVSQE